MEYVVIFEKGENSYGASVPDLPGCIAVGETMEEVRELIAEAIEFHIEGLREDGELVPRFPPSLADPGQPIPIHQNIWQNVRGYDKLINISNGGLNICQKNLELLWWQEAEVRMAVERMNIQRDVPFLPTN